MIGIRYILFLLFLIGLCHQILASNSPAKRPLPEILKIERLISESLQIKSEYIESEKSKDYFFPQLNTFSEDILTNEEDDMADIYKITKEYEQNEKVKKVVQAVEGLDIDRMINVFTGTELVKLPLGIVKTIGSTEYTVVFDSAKFFPDHAEVKVYARIKNDKYDLCFGADDIKFSYDGGIIGNATLALYGDFAVPMKSDKIAVIFNSFQSQIEGEKDGSYVTFDCDGFVQARLDIDVVLSREWVLPTDPSGKVIGGGKRVVGNAAATVNKLDDFVAEATMPYFTLTKDTSVAVLVDRAIFDLSETTNAPGFDHPLVYNFETGTYNSPPPPEELPLWTGFYLGKLEFLMPHVFKTENDLPLIVGAEQLYIDHKGVSGYVYADNVIPLETGRIGESEWAFSVDHIGVDLNYNRIISFDFFGKFNIPVNKETQHMNYDADAIPSQDYYSLTVGMDSIMSFPIFKAADVRLNKGTAVNISVKEGKFIPNAILCGGMYVKIGKGDNDSDGKIDLDMPGVEFHKLLVRDTMPYLMLSRNGGAISLKDPPIINNSPITLSDLTLTRIGENRVSLGFGVEVNVQDSDSGGGKTGGAFGILGIYKEQNGKNRWQYDGVEVNAMSVEIVLGNFAWIAGGLEFYEGDEVWGNGFYGYLQGGFIPIDKDQPMTKDSKYKLNMWASARFGTKFPDTPEMYKYWSLDLYVSSDEYAVPLFTPVSANGIGGGVYHHMKMDGYDTRAMAEDSKNPYSGISYVPDSNIMLGVKFSLGFVIDNVDGFKGNITLELAIDHNLALQNIMIYGNGEFVNELFKVDAESRLSKLSAALDEALEDIDKQANDDKEDKITAAMMIHMDFEKGFELHGSFGAYLDAAKGRISGQGTIDLYISDQRKHLYIGGYDGVVDLNNQPIESTSVTIEVAGFSTYAEFYFLTGNDLPAPPSVPYSVATLLEIPTNSNNRSSLPNDPNNPVGQGFALGASLEINTEFTQWPLKAIVDVEVGFDISLLSNPAYSVCSLSSVSPHGIKYWRARGQIYGSVYTDIKAFGVKLSNRMIAFLVRADLPRPAYLDVQAKFRKRNGNIREVDKQFGTQCGQVLLN